MVKMMRKKKHWVLNKPLSIFMHGGQFVDLVGKQLALYGFWEKMYV